MSKRDEREQDEIGEMLKGLTKEQVRAMLLADQSEDEYITEEEIKRTSKKWWRFLMFHCKDCNVLCYDTQEDKHSCHTMDYLGYALNESPAFVKYMKEDQIDLNTLTASQLLEVQDAVRLALVANQGM